MASGHESYRLEGQHFGEHVVVAVDVEHGGLMLLGGATSQFEKACRTYRSRREATQAVNLIEGGVGARDKAARCR